LPILLLIAIPIALLIWAIRAIWKRVKRRKRAKETTTA
jgi:cytochrome c-type biogenesis protein CcmH/NrfF